MDVRGGEYASSTALVLLPICLKARNLIPELGKRVERRRAVFGVGINPAYEWLFERGVGCLGPDVYVAVQDAQSRFSQFVAE